MVDGRIRHRVNDDATVFQPATRSGRPPEVRNNSVYKANSTHARIIARQAWDSNVAWDRQRLRQILAASEGR